MDTDIDTDVDKDMDRGMYRGMGMNMKTDHFIASNSYFDEINHILLQMNELFDSFTASYF
jgi:hypothetical protein